MSLLLLLACLCGAAARGAPTSLRDLSKSELDDYCQRHRGDGDAQLLGGEPTSTDDDGFTASQCWSQMIACVDVEYATPDFSVDGIFIATDVTIRKAVKLWVDDEAKATKKYGHISRWETGNVTKMAFLFCVREEWMEDHTWDALLYPREPTPNGTGSTGTAVLMLVQDLRTLRAWSVNPSAQVSDA